MITKLKILLAVLGAFVLVIYATASAGVFGPTDSDRKLVVISGLAGGNCPDGTAPFQVMNGSRFTVKNIDYHISGTIEGRSTEYPLSPPDSPQKLDSIMGPRTFYKGCLPIDSSRWPKEEKLIVRAQVEWADLE